MKRKKTLICSICIILLLSIVGCKENKLTKEEKELIIEYDELERPMVEKIDNNKMYHVEPKLNN